ISLQKGYGREQLAQLPDTFPVLDLGDRLDAEAGAFMDTAAIMQSLDLVISSDTALAHLAGALGVRVWIVLPSYPDWRWLLARSHTPCIPTARLFRQRATHNWRTVFADLAAELRKMMA